ncbi:MAG: tetratricopeptide repeat protein [Pseudomonadota bacterium]
MGSSIGVEKQCLIQSLLSKALLIVLALVCYPLLSVVPTHGRTPNEVPDPPLTSLSACAAGLSDSVIVSARKGDHAALVELYNSVQTGRCSNSVKALVNWLELASSHGLPDAMFELAARLELGEAVAYDVERALKLYLRLAETGHVLAQHRAGLLILRSAQSNELRQEALNWLGTASSNGHGLSALILGHLYEQGAHGVPQEKCTALHWYEASSFLGMIAGKRYEKKLAAQRPCD